MFPRPVGLIAQVECPEALSAAYGPRRRHQRHVMSIPRLTIGNFACFAINTRVSSELRCPAQLGDSVYATTEMPFQINDFWRENIGKIDTDHIANSNLFLLAQSDDPESTSRVLLDKVNTFHFALLLQGLGYWSACSGRIP